MTLIARLSGSKTAQSLAHPIMSARRNIIADQTHKDSCKDLENPVTSLNYKEVRPFFLSDNSIWSFPSLSSLSDLQHLEVLKAICLSLRS